MAGKEKIKKGKSGLGNFLKIYLKNTKRNVLVNIITSAIIFSVITSIFFIWNAEKNDNLIDYLSDTSIWSSDNKFSVSYSTIKENYNANYSPTYLDDMALEIKGQINSIYQTSLINNNFSGLMSLEVYAFNDTVPSGIHGDYLTFTSNIDNILNQSLVSGRLPENNSEILFLYQENSTYNFELNSQITLKLGRYEDIQKNFTISGIVKDLSGNLTSNGLSSEILNWHENIENWRYMYSSEISFISTPPSYFLNLNEFSTIDYGRAVVIDYNYDTTNINAPKLVSYISKHQELINGEIKLETEPSEFLVICNDLYDTLSLFVVTQLIETIKIITLIFPLILSAYILINEISGFGKVTSISTLNKFKIIGKNNKELRNIVLYKNLIVFSFGSTFGLILGFFVSYSVKAIYYQNVTLANFMLTIIDTFFLLFTITSFVLILFSGLFKEIKLLNNLKDENLKLNDPSKIEKKNRIFKLPELLVLTFGLVLVIPSSIIFSRSSIQNPTIVDTSFLTQNVISIIAFIILYFGAFLCIIIVIIIINRLIVRLFDIINRDNWPYKKNIFTYIVKNISTSKEIYSKVMFLTFLISFGLTPGLTITKSVNNHISLESKLATGCSDIIINNWDKNPIPTSIIEGINGIDNVTFITIYYIHHHLGTRNIIINMAAIHNLEEFIAIANIEELGKIAYTEDDIKRLENNLSYLMEKKFAKKYNYDKGTTILSNNFFGPKSKIVFLNFAGYFEYFPTLPVPINDDYDPYSLTSTNSIVTSLNTALLLEESATISHEKEIKILVKTSQNNNSQQVCDYLINNYNLEAFTEESIAQIITKNTNSFFIKVTLLLSFLQIMISIIFGLIVSKSIYQERLAMVEIEYRIGISKRKISNRLVLEIILLVFIPLVCSIISSTILVSRMASTLVQIIQEYLNFSLWLPWWMIVVIFLISSLLIIGSTFLGIESQLKKYKPVKTE